MGKPYTEEERAQIHDRLLEAGLELFHEAGVKDLSIRELTRRAGIAQGGFYNFFPDKDAFVQELIYYRTSQKVGLMETSFAGSEADPAGYVSSVIFTFTWNLKQKAEQKRMYADILTLYIREKPSERARLYAVFDEALRHLADYWAAQGVSVAMDIRGVTNVIRGVLILFANLGELDGTYTETIIRTFIEANVKNYVRIEEAKQ